MTRMPDCASSAASIAPAAPTPTMTTSVLSVAMSRAPRLGLEACDGCTRERLTAFELVGREDQLHARETDESPAGEILVSAIDRIGKHALHRVGAKRFEEGAGGRPSEAFRLALVQRVDGFVLLRR